MVRWKARGRLPISANWTFSASYHGWGAMSRYWSKLRCLKGGGSLWTQISGGKKRPPTTIFGTRKVESLGYRTYDEKNAEKKCNRLSRVHQRYRQTTDNRQTTDGRPIAYSLANVNVSGINAISLNSAANELDWSLALKHFQHKAHKISMTRDKRTGSVGLPETSIFFTPKQQ